MNEPIPIPEAAKSLNVSQRTVWNYIRKGRLDKVMVGRKVHVSRDSVERLSQPEMHIVNESNHLIPGKAMLEVSYLEGLLTLLGQLKAEKHHLLENQAETEAEKRELTEARARLIELEIKESEARSKVAVLEKENKYIRTILWILVGVGLSLVVGTISLLLKRT
jgi:excisionase family DNA binding protein